MLVRRTIKNVEQEYEYKGKEKKYDAYVQVKIEKAKKEKLLELANKKGYKDYAKLLREVIDKLLEDM